MARGGWPAGALSILVLCGGSAAAESDGAYVVSGPASYLVDVPTSGLALHGTLEARGRVFPGGGLEARLDLGLLDRFELGVAFGGLQLIGDGNPRWYPRPGFALRVRALEETWTLPALAAGIDTRGGGFWDPGRRRFQFKSRGLYAVASKNYSLLGDLALHGGVSRSFEARDDGDPTVFGGLEKSLGPRAAIAVEYDLASNDNRDDRAYGKGRGYLNGALRIRVAAPLELRVIVRDMLDNSDLEDPGLSDVVADEGWGREVALTYVAHAF
jgi:hypothetical protein